MKCPYSPNVYCDKVDTAAMTKTEECTDCSYFKSKPVLTILRPVQTRLPELNKPVPVLFQKYNKMFYGTFFYDGSAWKYADLPGITKNKATAGCRVVCWYEEIAIDLLLPDEDTGYIAAKNASNDRLGNTAFHQEGQTYTKNYIKRKLQS